MWPLDDAGFAEAYKAMGQRPTYAAPALQKARSQRLSHLSVRGARALVSVVPSAFQYVSSLARDDRATVLSAVQVSGDFLKLASVRLRDDAEIVRAAVSSRSYWGDDAPPLTHASPRLQNDAEMLRFAVQFRFGMASLDGAEKSLLDSEVFQASILRAVHVDPALVEPAARDNAAVVERAVCDNPRALDFASERLRNDKAFVRRIVGRAGAVFNELPELLQNDRELLLLALHAGGVRQTYEIRHRFGTDRDVVKEFIRTLPTNEIAMFLIGILDTHWPDDREVMTLAIGRAPQALQFSNAAFKDDDALVRAAMQHDACVVCFASDRLRDDDGLAKIALTGCRAKEPGRDPGALEAVSARLQADKPFVLQALRINGLDVGYAPAELRADPEVMRTAVAQNGFAWPFAEPPLRNDPALLTTAIGQNVEVVRTLSAKLSANKALMLDAVTRDGGALCFASVALQRDSQLIKARGPQKATWLDPSADFDHPAAPCIRRLALQANTAGGH